MTIFSASSYDEYWWYRVSFTVHIVKFAYFDEKRRWKPLKHWITIRYKHRIKISCKNLFRLNKLTTSSGGRLHPEPQRWSALTSSQKLPYFFNFLLTYLFSRKTRSVMKNLRYLTTLLLSDQRSLLEFPHLLHIPFQF